MSVVWIFVDVSTWMVKKKQDDGSKIEEDGSLFQEEDDCSSEEEANDGQQEWRRDFQRPKVDLGFWNIFFLKI